MKFLRFALAVVIAFSVASPQATYADVPDDVVIVFDASGSMKGERMRAARSATITFVNSIPQQVRLALVVFDDSARLRVPLTTSRVWIVAALNNIRPNGDTALYDGIARGLNVVRGSDNARLVVFSDGADTSSSISLNSLLRAVAERKTPLSIIALAPDPQQRQDLNTLAVSSGGQLLAAQRIDQLVELFSDALPTPTASPTQTPTNTPTASPSPTSTDNPVNAMVNDPGWPRNLAVIVFITMAWWLVRTMREARLARARKEITDILNTYADMKKVARKEHNPMRKVIQEWWQQRLPQTAHRLEEARISMLVDQWVYLWFFIGIGSALALRLFINSLLVVTLLGVTLAWLLARAVLRRGRNKALREFEADLPSTLALLASSLRSGLTFAQALDTVVQEGDGEIARQFRQALLEVKVGTSLEEALQRVAERMQSDDLKWAVTGLTIQREVGGSLSKILDTSASTIAKRAELRREVKTLSAEGRLSAYVLAGLPVVIFLFLLITRPQYVEVFWTDPIGVAMMIAMLAAFATGWLWVNKLVKVKV
jgi:tight adherence protein B